jgi:hypothetical protein
MPAASSFSRVRTFFPSPARAFTPICCPALQPPAAIRCGPHPNHLQLAQRPLETFSTPPNSWQKLALFQASLSSIQHTNAAAIIVGTICRHAGVRNSSVAFRTACLPSMTPPSRASHLPPFSRRWPADQCVLVFSFAHRERVPGRIRIVPNGGQLATRLRP